MLPRRSPGVTVVPSFLPRGLLLLLLLDVMVNDGRHNTYIIMPMMDFPFCGRERVRPAKPKASWSNCCPRVSSPSVAVN